MSRRNAIRRQAVGLTALSILGVLWTHDAEAAPSKIAVWPVQALNMDTMGIEQLESTLFARIRRLPDVQIIDVRRTAQSLDQVTPPCHEQHRCLQRAGRRLGAQRILVLRAARLAETYVLRLTLFNVQAGVPQGRWQEVLRQLHDDVLVPAFDRMLAGVAPAAERRPWYTRWWWLWPTVAVVAAGGVTAIILANQGSSPDVVITPP